MTQIAIGADEKPEISSALVKEQQIWHGIIGTGQSLSVGYQGAASNPTQVATGGLKINDTANRYDISAPEAKSLHVVPYAEPLRKRPSGGSHYPWNIEGITLHPSMTHVIAKAHSDAGVNDPYMTAHTVVGIGGATMELIRKDGTANAYEASLYEARVFSRIAKEQNCKVVYEAIMLTHGESDAVLNNAEYADQIMRMHQDYAQDLRAITGQSHEPVLILSQQNTCPPTNQLYPTVMQAMWQVQQQSRNAVVCAGPKYQYEYAVGGVHLPSGGYNRLGEKYGQVYYETVVQGRPFVPLSPKVAVRSDNPDFDVAVHLHVPKPPLVWDDYLPMPHQDGRHQAWKAGRGFEVRDAKKSKIAIDRVSIEGDTVLIKLEAAESPPAYPLRMGYAMSQIGDGFPQGFCGGTSDGRLGHLCDSDRGMSIPTRFDGCKVGQGSPIVYSPSGWEGRTLYDLVEPGGYVIMEIDDHKAQLDRSWKAGSSDNISLVLRHNQRNFCVSFVMEVT